MIMSSVVGMRTVFGTVVTLISIAGVAGVGDNITAIDAACNTIINFTCSDPDGFTPSVFVNGTAETGETYISGRDENTGAAIGTAIINGSAICGSESNIYCPTRHRGNLHNTSLTVNGPLPSPENVHINELNKSLIIIEWTPPYLTSNQVSDVVQVDPLITQYTIYIIDYHTGDIIREVNTTDTQFTIRIDPSDGVSCPMYGITAWNSGGEGRMSEPVYLPLVPQRIATENIRITAESEGLHIRLHVIDPCTVRSPKLIFVTWRTTAGVNSMPEDHHHKPGHPVDIRIRLPKNVEKCNLTISIRASNSAGVSSPTEIVVDMGCQATGHNTSTIPTTRMDTSSTDIFDQTPQGDNSRIYIGVGVGFGAVVVVAAVVVLLLIIRWKYRRTTEVKSSEGARSPVYHPDSHSGPSTGGSCYADVETTQGKSKLTPPQDARVHSHDHEYNTCTLSVSNPYFSDSTPVEEQGLTQSKSTSYANIQVDLQHPSSSSPCTKKHEQEIPVACDTDGEGRHTTISSTQPNPSMTQLQMEDGEGSAMTISSTQPHPSMIQQQTEVALHMEKKSTKRYIFTRW